MTNTEAVKATTEYNLEVLPELVEKVEGAVE